MENPGKKRIVFVVILSFVFVATAAFLAVNIFISRQGADGIDHDSSRITEEKTDEAVIKKPEEISKEEASGEIYFSKIKGLEVMSPRAGQEIKSPLAVSGRVKQSWLFEGSFGAKLMDSRGNVFSSASAEAADDWPDKDWVEFTSTIEFSQPNDAEGFLLLAPDNIVGTLSNNFSVSIPVRFSSESGLDANSEYIYGRCGRDPKDDPILGDCGEDCDTAGWKVYKNKKYGYSFRYDPAFSLTNKCKDANCISEEQGGDVVMLQGDLSRDGWPMITISHHPNEYYNPPPDIPTSEWVMEKFPWIRDCSPNEENIYFRDENGEMFGGENIYFPKSPQAYSRREIYYMYKNKLFQIIMLDVDSDQARQFYDNWLSTFKVVGENI